MRRLFASAFVLVALATLLAPSAAWAASVREYQLQFSPVADTGTSQMIVTALLDPGASLPATVSVPVPAGATLLWSGELLGGAAENDPTREAQVTRIGSMDVYTFTLEESYLGQVELEMGAPEISGSKVASSITWTNPGAEVLVSASVIAEPGAGKVSITPEVAGASRTNENGETLYPLGGVRVLPGGAYTIDVEWRRGGGTFPLLAIVGGALALATFTLVLLLARERTRARRAAVRRERRPAEAGWE